MFFLSQFRIALGPEELFFVDVTAATHWASEAIEVQGTRRYFTPADNQSMGWAIPAAIGGQRVRPDRQVVCVTGDGCFLMSAIEMSTAARAGLPVKFFVLDDQAYGFMQKLQVPVYRRTTATVLARLDYPALAKALGVGYQEITSTSEVAAGVRGALETPGPVLTRVVTDYRDRPIRWMDAVKGRYKKELSMEQKMRFAGRLGTRALELSRDND